MSDRTWMYKRLDEKYLSSDFVKGVDEFIKVACEQENYKKSSKLKCPCLKCHNRPYLDVDTVKLHLYKDDFCPNYTYWICHGENLPESQNIVDESSSVGINHNPYHDMVVDALGYNTENNRQEVDDIEEEPNTESRKFFEMLKNAEEPLYEGCKLSVLEAASRLTNIKCEFNILHRAVDNIAFLMKDMCPDDNKMTDTYSKTKKLLEGLELPHQKIDAYPYGCMLFWNEDEHLNQCRKCKSARYKKNKISENVLRYFPITPRLQRLYATKGIAENMTWHSETHRTNGHMSHPSDGEAWQNFDEIYPDFSVEPRNVRLGLCTDGFAPFGKSGKSYSCWPVILTPYNLPPSLCMKRQFMFLTLIIPGPKSPKGNLDVYLQPLIAELNDLWERGAITYDVSRKNNFNLKAAIIWTISDFPAYGMLSGWSTAGKFACPYCMERTGSFYLKNGSKYSWFDCHRTFLPIDHEFRLNRSAFTRNRVEPSSPPPRLNGEEVWNCVSCLPKGTDLTFSTDKRKNKKDGWKRQCIFWQLPYWRKLLIRHNLDVMHIEKNVFDQIIHTIMEVKGKIKDTISARKDLATHCKRRKLNMEGKNGDVMPKAPYVLSKEQKRVLCEWIQNLKFLDGYSSNIGRCVDMKQYKLFGLKSHDCHVFKERLLPVALRELLPQNVWKALTEISQFFKAICSSLLEVEDMVRLEINIPEILCKLEKIFPPAFFN
ncbi:uncharacterized protein LOC141651059 [Silene latifolia]|uniref:uncharacterized protein LOC141651059 n=1 Tax=Silene latifolia TaxID=37657 RepID=UPI003D7866B8